MGALSLVDATVLLLASHTGIVWVAYGAHIIYRSSFAFVITMALTKVAVSLFAFQIGQVLFDHDLCENNQSAQPAYVAEMHPWVSLWRK